MKSNLKIDELPGCLAELINMILLPSHIWPNNELASTLKL